MTIFLTVVHILVCLILILVILLQAGRGQGLTGASFSSGNVQSLFGTRAADFLTKATSVAAICFLFTCLGLNILETQKSRSLFEAGQEAAPVDMETIKKALEKIKAEKGAGAASDSKAGAETAGNAKAVSQPAATASPTVQTAAATPQPPAASQTPVLPPSQTASGEADKNSPSTASKGR